MEGFGINDQLAFRNKSGLAQNFDEELGEDEEEISNTQSDFNTQYNGILSDAPERKQRGGLEARDQLKRILEAGNNRVKLNIVETDRYGRSVAEVWNGNDTFVKRGITILYYTLDIL